LAGISSPASILKDTFGYDIFRPLQREVIENILAGRDTLAVMPTGGGKSLCYQIPALMLDGLTVVVSPLIALMKDQVEQLRANGVPAAILNSSLSSQEYQENVQLVRTSSAKLLYLAPETLLTERIFSLLSQVRLSLLTIDEAHCISEWGHDFRPQYRQIMDMRQRFPGATCLALTATATERVRADIKSSLKFTQSNEFVASFNRENLFIEVASKVDGMQQVVHFLSDFKDQSGIIYCFSRRQVEELAVYLSSRGFSVRPYHARLENTERESNQEAFIHDDVQIIVATIAFGMGINKPNVRFVVHYDLPKSIEGYYQEIGRAGRDGLPAHCLLLYSYSDIAKLRYFIDQKDGNEQLIASQHLNAIVRYAEEETDCRRKPLLAYFGEEHAAGNCTNCDNCTSVPEALTEITIPAQKFLSCVLRVRQRFGGAYVADVLRGSKSQKVLRNGHDQLSTYGIGGDLTKKQWMHFSRQLVQMDYLNQDSEYLTLSLTQKGHQALMNRTQIMGRFQEVTTRLRKDKVTQEKLDYDQALFALLRQMRKDLADEGGVPPYVIFSDKTLVEMSAYYPQSLDSLLTMNGVGHVKLNQYGEIFLRVIKPYCEKNGVEEIYKGSPHKKSESNRRYLLVGQAYNDGKSILSLMGQYKVKANTIVDHLARFVSAGNVLRNGSDLRSQSSLPIDQQGAALCAFEELGTLFLRPVFDRLNGKVSYDELKIMRLIALSQQK
jgi:ATP-dependent DNA helicase RecQ